MSIGGLSWRGRTIDACGAGREHPFRPVLRSLQASARRRSGDSVATWLPHAAFRFTESTGNLLELFIEDEAFTAGRLQSGEVIAAVSATRASPGLQDNGAGQIAIPGLLQSALCRGHFRTASLRSHLPGRPVFASTDGMACRRFRRGGLTRSNGTRLCTGHP